MEKVSIIVIVYNSARTLSKCLKSCIEQTYINIEIVVVCDGSPDNSYDIAKSFQEKDNRIILINKENEGIPRTRRVGFENSTGEYILHLDADDYLEPKAIDILYEKAKNENADIVIGGLIFEDNFGNIMFNWICNISSHATIEYLKDLFLSKIPPFIFGRLIKRKIFESVHVPAQYNCGEDIISNVMMICYNPKLKIVSEPKLVQHYLNYKESLTNSSKALSFMQFTNTIADVLMQCNKEEFVMNEWSYFRVIKCWREYLRKGGTEYLKDKKFVTQFYKKYYTIQKNKLNFIERLELNLYKFNQPLAWNFSRVYVKILKLTKHTVN